jgi:hypothetical protein
VPLDREFKQHLHDVMVEVSEAVAESEAEHKRQLIWKAQQTNNRAAMPVAYKEAAIHSLRTRFEKTVERYFEALSAWGIEIDSEIEKEMLQQINLLTSGPSYLSLPPALKGGNVEAVQQSYAMERTRVAHQLRREAKNRFSEFKMKAKRSPQPSNSITHVYNMPLGRVYNNSVDQSTNTIEITRSELEDIDRISQGNQKLEAASKEIREAYPQNATMFEKVRKWVGLVASVEGLTEKVVQHYPQIVALMHRVQQM